MIIKKIDTRSFRRYGRVIEYPPKENKGRKNLFRIVLKEPRTTGWRIAYLVVRDKHIGRLEQHPYSFESFEPVKGKSLLFVAAHKDEKAIECFRLDRPVIVNKGVWHGVVTVSPETEIKICENLRVKCVYWPLTLRLPLL